MSAPLENVARGLASLGRFEDNYIVKNNIESINNKKVKL